MKVFISWSGERSQILAKALHVWLPLVLHYVQPWLSEADVAAGDRWAQTIAQELESSNFGVICVTPENLNSPWVLFEAGALAKSMQGSKVIPLLFGLEFSDISGPLAQFQAKKLDRSGFAEVVHSINQSAPEPIPDDREKQLFTALWPELEKRLEDIPDEAPTERHTRPAHEILEELVTGVRGLDTRFRDLENTVDRESPRSRKRLRHFHPGMFEEIAEMVSEEANDPVSLLMFGGFFREDFPWLYEILMNAYRDIRDGDSKAAQKAIDRLRRVTRAMGHHPMMDEMIMGRRGDKETHMLMRELPMMLDHFLSRFERRQLKGANEPEVEDEENSSSE